MLALIPGVSRSGACIIGGMLCGLHRATATVFSFYLAVPTLGTATIFRLLIDVRSLDGSSLAMLLAGALVSGLVAWYATGWLLRFAARRDFTAFGVYRIAAGLLIFALVAAGRL
jgi:undecaprenyl-diphosphatase